MITLENAKLHSRIDNDDEDDLLNIYLSASINACLTYLNRSVYEDAVSVDTAIQSGDDTAMLVNGDIKAAMLITFASFYEYREASSAIPKNAQWLLNQYRKIPGI